MVNRKENTKQAILKAMVMLLKTESFDDITTVKLSKRAGISRSSFYTHYKDKYEMIDYYQQTFFHKLEYIFEKNIKIKNKPSLKYLNFSKENSFSSLLSANGTKEIQAFIINKVRLLITTDLQDKFRTEELSQTEKEYRSIYLAHAFLVSVKVGLLKVKRITSRNDTIRSQNAYEYLNSNPYERIILQVISLSDNFFRSHSKMKGSG